MAHKPSNIRTSIPFKIDDLMDGLKRYGVRAQKKVEKYLEESARELRAYMRENRLWQDRTSKARLSLDAKVEHPKERYYRIALKHGVYYGYYLEYHHEKRFAILEPTARLKGPEIMEGMRGLLN